MSKSVVIIGGGVVGLCSAYYLQKEGCKVTVIDKSPMNAGASYVNAGYLTPSHIIPMAAPGMITTGLRYMFNSSSPFYMKPRLDANFIKWAWNFKKSATQKNVDLAIPVIKEVNVLSRELFTAIKNSGDLGCFHLERKGLLMLYQTDKERDHELIVSEKAKFLGLEVKELDKEGISRVEPNININAKGAIHYECDGHSTPSEFMARMKAYLENIGVHLIKNQEVTDVIMNHKSPCEVKTLTASYYADEIVLAAGSWSGKLAKKLGLKLSIEAGKGYRINVQKETNIKMPAILMEAKMAVTPMKGFTRFAGTMEFSGINHDIRKERVKAIVKGAVDFYEGLSISAEDKNNAQCGLRPVTPDGLPYIGKSKKHKNLTVATGHAMMGWSLGPVTGKLISELICDKDLVMDITPFDPDRRF